MRLWFGWAFLLLAVTGLLMGRIVEFIDFSERAPFSLLGIFMMIELAAVLFGITVALQRKRIAHRFAIGIALLPVPILAGLPPILLEMPPVAANGWYTLTVPIGLAIGLKFGAALIALAAGIVFMLFVMGLTSLASSVVSTSRPRPRISGSRPTRSSRRGWPRTCTSGGPGSRTSTW